MKGQKLIAIASLIILLVPALFYILLTRGKNEFVHLPVYGNVSSTLTDGWIDQKDNKLNNKKFENKYLVVSFYTVNGDTMNKELNGHLKKVQYKFSDAGDVNVVSILAMQNNSTISLSSLAEKEGALYGKWYFSNPGNDTFLHKVENDLMIGQPVNPDSCYKTVYLIDKQKQIRGIHDATDSWAVDTLMDEIKLLRWEEWEKEKNKSK